MKQVVFEPNECMGQNEVKLMAKLALEWVQTSDHNPSTLTSGRMLLLDYHNRSPLFNLL